MTKDATIKSENFLWREGDSSSGCFIISYPCLIFTENITNFRQPNRAAHRILIWTGQTIETKIRNPLIRFIFRILLAVCALHKIVIYLPTALVLHTPRSLIASTLWHSTVNQQKKVVNGKKSRKKWKKKNYSKYEGKQFIGISWKKNEQRMPRVNGALKKTVMTTTPMPIEIKIDSVSGEEVLGARKSNQARLPFSFGILALPSLHIREIW